jgi:hypothetical protein
VHFGSGVFRGIDVLVHSRFQFGGLRLVVIRTSFLFFTFFAFLTVRDPIPFCWEGIVFGIGIRLFRKLRRRRVVILFVLGNC